ncbi:MAG TPA: glucose-6-phosphate isomerase [Gemmatimonadales bacterium]|jgi:glucose-6-phosphate isomerase|nr:glucose-6-phosphate isomerase [Gemmatimonadales bacterium]
MTFTFDDRYMFRDALNGVHGLDPALRNSIAARFADVSREVQQRTAAGDYGFTTLGEQPDLIARLTAWAAPLKGRFDHLIVLGIGGSALGPKALVAALKSPNWNEWSTARRGGFPTVTVLENVDPVTVMETLDRFDPRRTLVNVISKSGGTAETLAQYLIVRAWLEQAVGKEAACAQLVITTDPAKGALRALAREEKITAFDVPPGVGGRYSVLTAVGLVPAVLVGIDCAALLAGAEEAVKAGAADTLEANDAARWAAWQWQAQVSRAANVHIVMPYSDRLRQFSEWYRQLWAESLGKRKDREGRDVFRGPTPVGAVGTTDQHSQVQLFIEGPFDKTITFIRVLDTATLLPIPSRPGLDAELSYLPGKTLGALLDAEMIASREALRSQGRMSMTLEVGTVDARHLGRLMMFFQIATGYAGIWYDVNPFDQPGVELGKVLTFKAMGRSGY